MDSALAAFYETAIAQVVNRPELGVSEQQLRTWFSTKLITEAGTRGTVFRDERSGLTAGLPNAAVEVLARQFLLRTELRAGGAWVELVHDRFVAPILRANCAHGRRRWRWMPRRGWLRARRPAGSMKDRNSKMPPPQLTSIPNSTVRSSAPLWTPGRRGRQRAMRAGGGL